ncbi:MAG TPA: PAS domain-containing sensor histidine kinase [Clostridiales bacterium]|jgi:two-component system phosphate regulon sensor histidine kinase PhoR|nr:PAS domain-containing sensor histidine kinase [Clostridiales bacterium]
MKKRIFWNIFLSSLIAALLFGGAILFAQYRAFEALVVSELITECDYAQSGLLSAADEKAYLERLSSRNRLTLIATDGTVLFDSASDVTKMDNHADRPEISDAKISDSGTSSRYSSTQLLKNYYYARLLPDGRVLRVASSQSSVLGMLNRMLPAMIGVLLLILIISVFFARFSAKIIIRPINALDLENPLSNATYDELAPLLTGMERQRRENISRMEALSEKQREFTAVTENMREGFILLDASDRILAINGSASKIFGAEPSYVIGAHVLMLNRSVALQQAMEQSKKDGSGQATLIRGAYTYQVLASQVKDNLSPAGTVILILDISDRVAAEQMRREFSANVSHELKTPLTSILGYAEIMRDGVAKAEDTRRFAGKIFSEASQLMSLIDDIIRLSQLDEKTSLPEMTPIDLKEICEDVCQRLQPQAEKAGVSLNVNCARATVRGIQKILEEIVLNLVDNAIKYNTSNGSVGVTLRRNDQTVELSVSDTGIGIPEEHLSRVFERFYRVDRSRNKQIGGTGLGLSIVKHSAETLGAAVQLESRLGIGSTITVTFPAID